MPEARCLPCRLGEMAVQCQRLAGRPEDARASRMPRAMTANASKNLSSSCTAMTGHWARRRPCWCCQKKQRRSLPQGRGRMIGLEDRRSLAMTLTRPTAPPGFVLWQQQGVVTLVNGPLKQAIDPQGRVGLTTHTDPTPSPLASGIRACPHARSPTHCCLSRPLGGNRFDRRAARIPLEDEGDLARHRIGLDSELWHQLGRPKTRVCAHQQRRSHQTGSHRTACCVT